MKIQIRPACDTFDSFGKALAAGETYEAPGDISVEDAEIIISGGKADTSEEDAPKRGKKA